MRKPGYPQKFVFVLEIGECGSARPQAQDGDVSKSRLSEGFNNCRGIGRAADVFIVYTACDNQTIYKPTRLRS